MKNKFLTAIASIAITLAIGITSINVTSSPIYAANSMKVESFTGNVTLKNSKGKAKTLKSGVNLVSGDKITTQSNSTANVLLDKTKAALIEECSSVTAKKSGNDFDLIVDSGSVFFDVSKKLSSNESFKIKTSNMICGIRGTVGEVKTVTDKKKKTQKTYVYLLEGNVNITYNATKSSKKTKTIKAGQKLTISTDISTGKSTINVAKIKISDINQSVAIKIQSNHKLKSRVKKSVKNLDWTKLLSVENTYRFEDSTVYFYKGDMQYSVEVITEGKPVDEGSTIKLLCGVVDTDMRAIEYIRVGDQDNFYNIDKNDWSNAYDGCGIFGLTGDSVWWTMDGTDPINSDGSFNITLYYHEGLDYEKNGVYGYDPHGGDLVGIFIKWEANGEVSAVVKKC